MPRAPRDIAVPVNNLLPPEPPPPPLKRQRRWSGKPWKPGQIPADPLMVVSRAHDQQSAPYGHGSMGIESPPVGRGKLNPLKGGEGKEEQP